MPAKSLAKSFRAYDDWSPAHTAAKYAACAAHGLMWSLRPGAYARARLPASWVACKVYGRVSRSPRDVRLPAARFWPDGTLPTGPEYAPEPLPIRAPKPPRFVRLADMMHAAD